MNLFQRRKRKTFPMRIKARFNAWKEAIVAAIADAKVAKIGLQTTR